MTGVFLELLELLANRCSGVVANVYGLSGLPRSARWACG